MKILLKTLTAIYFRFESSASDVRLPSNFHCCGSELERDFHVLSSWSPVTKYHVV